MKKNKNFLKKLAAVALGFVMTLGVGAAGYSASVSETHAAETTYTFTNKSWADSTSSWKSNSDGFGFDSSKGIQRTAGSCEGETKASISNITKISINAATTSKGVGTYTIYVGGTEVGSKSLSKASTSTDYDIYDGAAISGVVKINLNCTTNSLYIKSITITTGAAPSKQLSSIAISGNMSKTTYTTEDSSWDYSGLTATGTYDNGDTENVTSSVTWGATPAAPAENTTSVSIVASIGAISSQPHVETVSVNKPAYISIIPSNLTNMGTTKGSHSATYQNITFSISDGLRDSGNDHLRIYKGANFTISAPKNIEKIEFNDLSGYLCSNFTVDKGDLSNDGCTWTGDSKSVVFTASEAQVRVTKIKIYYKEEKAVSSIVVKTAPTTTEYVVGETFDPTGLVITATYNDASSDDIAYLNHEDSFTFIPSTSTALSDSDTSITIQYGGASTTQSINVRVLVLESIAVKTSPTKVSYNVGETFDPTGLVITATYDNESTVDISYAGNEESFSFSPNTSTALTILNTSVTITFGGETTSQAISVTRSTTRTVIIDGDGAFKEAHPDYKSPMTANVPETFSYGGVNIEFNATTSGYSQAKDGAATKNFSDYDIFIGQQNSTIRNTSPFPGNITKFEVLFAKGGSTNARYSLSFSDSELTTLGSTNVYTSGTPTLDSIVDLTSYLGNNPKYFFFTQTAASRNGRVQFRVTYHAEPEVTLDKTALSLTTSSSLINVKASTSNFSGDVDSYFWSVVDGQADDIVSLTNNTTDTVSITALKTGTTKIQCTATKGTGAAAESATAECLISVSAAPTTITLSGTGYSYNSGTGKYEFTTYDSFSYKAMPSVVVNPFDSTKPAGSLDNASQEVEYVYPQDSYISPRGTDGSEQFNVLRARNEDEKIAEIVVKSKVDSTVTATIAIDVLEDYVTGLTFTGTLTGKQYIGETFDPTGLTFKKTYMGREPVVANLSELTLPTVQSASGTVVVKFGNIESDAISYSGAVNPSVTIDQGDSKTVELGSTLNLSVTTAPAGKTVTWSSSNDSILTVSNGVVTPVSIGTANVTATYKEGISDSIEITVKAVHGTTQEDPLTPSEARKLSPTTGVTYYVEGVIIDASEDGYGYYCVSIKENESSSTYFELCFDTDYYDESDYGKYEVGETIIASFDSTGLSNYSSSSDYYCEDFEVVYYSGDKVFTSISISGSPTRSFTSYTIVDTAWNPEGIVVTGYYDGGSKVISSDVEWEFSPTAPAYGVTTVTVTAKFGDLRSNSLTFDAKVDLSAVYTDSINVSTCNISVTSAQYKYFSGKSFVSNTLYNGRSYITYSGGKSDMQFNKEKGFIYNTTSVGNFASISVEFNGTTNKIYVFGSNTPFSNDVTGNNGIQINAGNPLTNYNVIAEVSSENPSATATAKYPYIYVYSDGNNVTKNIDIGWENEFTEPAKFIYDLPESGIKDLNQASIKFENAYVENGKAMLEDNDTLLLTAYTDGSRVISDFDIEISCDYSIYYKTLEMSESELLCEREFGVDHNELVLPENVVQIEIYALIEEPVELTELGLETTPMVQGIRLTYNANGGENAPVDSIIYNAGEIAYVSSTVPSKVGNQFMGWSDGKGNTYYGGDSITMSSSVTLTAQWKVISSESTTAVSSQAKVSFDYVEEDNTLVISNLKVRVSAQLDATAMEQFGDYSRYDYGFFIAKASELDNCDIAGLLETGDYDLSALKETLPSLKKATWEGDKFVSNNKQGNPEFGANLKYTDLTSANINEEWVVVWYAYDTVEAKYYTAAEITFSASSLLTELQKQYASGSKEYQAIAYILNGGSK